MSECGRAPGCSLFHARTSMWPIISVKQGHAHCWKSGCLHCYGHTYMSVGGKGLLRICVHSYLFVSWDTPEQSFGSSLSQNEVSPCQSLMGNVSPNKNRFQPKGRILSQSLM